MPKHNSRTTDADALDFHASGRPGKLEIKATKPLTTQRDLSLAYSPGVAVPCLEIAKNPAAAYDYTAKGNLVAVISNGTAVLGLGNLGALGSKPVMEGKAVLFKRFADVDGIDLEVDTENVDEFVNCVRFLGKSFGGINLEDIKAPECFIIEQRLQELLDIPVFHDDQHGTAIIAAAGLLSAIDITGKDLKKIKMVVNGAGSAGIACTELVKALGVPHENILLCDTKGVIYQGREEGMNQWKSAHAVPTDDRTLEDAMNSADVVFGLSVKGAFTNDMIKSMAPNPIIFAMANPDPEITPEEVAKVRDDAIIATGRSDYPNQVNNVLGFPYIFRGALDVRASSINMEMKVAAAKALAELAQEDVPDEVGKAYAGRQLKYGRDYIIPAPFDPRLVAVIPRAVAEAAMESGVAGKNIEDLDAYERELSARLDPAATTFMRIAQKVRSNPKRVVFAEGEEESAIRAAVTYYNAGYGTPLLVGREETIKNTMQRLGINGDFIEIHNASISEHRERYTDYVYNRLQRKGKLYRDCQRMVNQNRNIFASCLVTDGIADAMVTGLTRSFAVSLDDAMRAINCKPGKRAMGMSMMIIDGKAIFVADTSVNEVPSSEQLADIAVQAASHVQAMGYEPRVAFLSFSNFGNPTRETTTRIRRAVSVLDTMNVSFEYEGEMQANLALDFELQQRLFPFSRLTGPANILIMPALHSANITTKLIQKAGGSTAVIGPMLVGLEKPVQIVPMGATVTDLVTMAALGAYESITNEMEEPFL
ncbi:malic enzyme [Kiloniella litopenaei]|uniref:Malic enzyme n=1 Tax=Kiloniella litopenaei TaxID=1549748 RepID=A0A0M2R668_9PROT|nr:NADP-dependent malic enzyme [Kiloniella litopenaei]KKJ77151.1 malic enzyme [Kiloniella litopenaei]